METPRLGRTGILPLRLEGPKGLVLSPESRSCGCRRGKSGEGESWAVKEMQSPEAKREEGPSLGPFTLLAELNQELVGKEA